MPYNIILVLIMTVTFSFSNELIKPEKESSKKRSEWLRATYENKNIEMPDNFRILQSDFSNSLPNAPEGFYSKGDGINSQTWVNAGPNNVGGRTRTLTFDRNNPNVLITGGVSGGIWRSVDGGNSWVQTTGTKDIVSVTDIIQDPRHGRSNEWYCAGGEYIGNSPSRVFSAFLTGNGIYKSTDNGLTWEKYGDTGDDKPQVYNRCTDPEKVDTEIR